MSVQSYIKFLVCTIFGWEKFIFECIAGFPAAGFMDSCF
jgi:hypothetical protein